MIVEKSGSKTRKWFCGLAIFVNIGTLVFFKYTGFLMENLKTILGRLGVSFPENIYTIFVPVGISFYVFQSVGYLIDVYRHKISAERNVINYALFIAFFPQIVSGPINRAGTLLPQLKTLHRKPNPTQLCEGLKLIFTGYLQKIVFADMFTIYIDAVYKDLKTWGGVTVLAAGILYSFQIYCDFAGYSNIAIGSARLLGIEIQENFNAPYRAVSIRDFWNRWHISLSTWLRDYIYFPLGGGRCSFLRKNLNIFIVFLVSGIWHGAAWNFIVWGLLHGVARVVEN
ncbi:MBOAT family protein, partial [Ruthenibacterium lactatiformans]|uniref:MBOAT family O-acyltransferase n=1 Tax=Ruthenibacterium lactatiformans TaxID=1550024 RepID=UPI0026DD9E15